MRLEPSVRCWRGMHGVGMLAGHAGYWHAGGPCMVLTCWRTMLAGHAGCWHAGGPCRVLACWRTMHGVGMLADHAWCWHAGGPCMVLACWRAMNGVGMLGLYTTLIFAPKWQVTIIYDKRRAVQAVVTVTAIDQRAATIVTAVAIVT